MKNQYLALAPTTSVFLSMVLGVGIMLASNRPAFAQTNSTSLIDLTKTGVQANFGAKGLPVMSGNGRYCAFASGSNNLDPADTDILWDTYLKDTWTGDLKLVSVSTTGLSGNGPSGGVLGISDDGRYVVFDSSASDLIPFDANGLLDVFVYDQFTDTTKCISVNPAGDPSNGASRKPQISGDGRYVSFQSTASDLGIGSTGTLDQVYVYDMLLGSIENVSLDSFGFEVDGSSRSGNLSYDGRFVAFRSCASNLVPNDTNGIPDYFVRDRNTGIIERVNVDSNGNQAVSPSWGATPEDFPGISDDGRFITFFSYSDNLSPQDMNGQFDVYVRDRQLGITELISVDSQGVQNFTPLGVYFATTAISGDGRYVCFDTTAPGLAPPDTSTNANVYVRDRLKGVTEMIDIGANGEQPTFSSGGASISRTGRYVAFWSQSNNLVATDSSPFTDVFLHDRMTGGARCGSHQRRRRAVGNALDYRGDTHWHLDFGRISQWPGDSLEPVGSARAQRGLGVLCLCDGWGRSGECAGSLELCFGGLAPVGAGD